MAKADLNPAFKNLRGSLDGYVYKKFKNGRVIVSKKPTHENTEWSELQGVGRSRWSDAAAYANAVWANPEARAFYEKVAKQTKAWRAYNLITSDYLNPPEIEDVKFRQFAGQPGDVISIRASDDIGVIAVEICIRDLTGHLWEQGPAPQAPTGRWDYALVHAIPGGTELEIEIAAQDRPGNRTLQWRKLTVPVGGA